MEGGGVNAVEIMIIGKMMASMMDMVTRSIEYALIVEDDIRIMVSPQVFRERMATVLQDDPQADFIFVGGCFGIHAKPSWQRFGEWLYRVPPRSAQASRCGHGYIVTQQGAKKYLEYGLPLLGPADWTFNLIHEHFPGVTIDFLEPPVICQGNTRGGEDQLECGHSHTM